MGRRAFVGEIGLFVGKSTRCVYMSVVWFKLYF